MIRRPSPGGFELCLRTGPSTSRGPNPYIYAVGIGAHWKGRAHEARKRRGTYVKLSRVRRFGFRNSASARRVSHSAARPLFLPRCAQPTLRPITPNYCSHGGTQLLSFDWWFDVCQVYMFNQDLICSCPVVPNLFLYNIQGFRNPYGVSV